MTDDDVYPNKRFLLEDADGMEVLSMVMGSSGTFLEDERLLTASGQVFLQVNAPVTYDEDTRTFVAKLPGKAFPVD